MELRINVYIAIGDYQPEEYWFTIDYDYTQEDLDDFGKYHNFNTFLGYVKYYYNEEDYNDILGAIKEGKLDWVIDYLDSADRKNFENFLAEKYHEKAENLIFNNLEFVLKNNELK